MIRLFKEKPNVYVVSDQIGCPTAASDLAGYLLMAATDARSLFTGEGSLVHFTGPCSMSWYDFAQYIAISQGYQGNLIAIHADQYKSLAQRPRNTIMSNKSIAVQNGRYINKNKLFIEYLKRHK